MGEAFDRQAVLDRFSGDLDLLRHIAELFSSSAVIWLKEIHEARANQDLSHLRRVAHTLKGSVGNFLAQNAAGAALRLQKLAEAGDVAQLDPAIAALEQEVARLREGLDKILSPPSSPA